MQLKLSRIDLSFLAPSLPPTSLSFTSPTAVYSPFIFSLPHPSFFYSYSFLFYFTLPSTLKNITPWRFRCRLSQKKRNSLPIPNRKYSLRQGERSQSKQKSINVPWPGCTYRYEPVYILYICRVSQEECTRLREGVPYVKVYRYNPKHQCPNLNGYGDSGRRSLKL